MLDGSYTEWRSSSRGTVAATHYCDTLDSDWTNTFANENLPGVAKEGQPTGEIEAQRKWCEGNARDVPESS